jgi:hypothetical protein
VRPVLALALTLLGITLLLNHSGDLLRRSSRERGADAALDVIVAAKGPLLPSGRLGAGPERIGEAIRVGDRTLTRASAESGLRVVTLGPGLAFAGQRCFDVAALDGALAFAEHVAERASGSLLLIASSGSLEPAARDREETREQLASALEMLGARARPFERTPESWALIAARLERGWVPLAEGYSADSGVVLAFSVAHDLERHVGRPGEYVEVRATGEVEVFLEEELVNAARRDPGIERSVWNTIGGRPMRAILQPPLASAAAGRSEPSRLAWKDVALGDGSGLLALIGLADGASAGSDGATFEVRIDGELVHAQRALPDRPWRLLQVDLRPFAGRTVELELAVDPGEDSTGDWALWGRPMLIHGFHRPPIGFGDAER